MLMNRRLMLAASATSVLSVISGCKKKSTTIVEFVNNSGAGVFVDLSAGDFVFNNTVAPGKSATQAYVTAYASGMTIATSGGVSLTEQCAPPCVNPAPLILSGYTITVGKKNTFTIGSGWDLTMKVS